MDTAYTSSSTPTISTLLPPSSTTCKRQQHKGSWPNLWTSTTSSRVQRRGGSRGTPCQHLRMHKLCGHQRSRMSCSAADACQFTAVRFSKAPNNVQTCLPPLSFKAVSAAGQILHEAGDHYTWQLKGAQAGGTLTGCGLLPGGCPNHHLCALWPCGSDKWAFAAESHSDRD